MELVVTSRCCSIPSGATATGSASGSARTGARETQERPPSGGTEGSNPASSSGESPATLTSTSICPIWRRRRERTSPQRVPQRLSHVGGSERRFILNRFCSRLSWISIRAAADAQASQEARLLTEAADHRQAALTCLRAGRDVDNPNGATGIRLLRIG